MATEKGTRIRQRAGTSTAWTNKGSAVTLIAREVGYETDSGWYKIGTGDKSWAQLSYPKFSKVIKAGTGMTVTEAENGSVTLASHKHEAGAGLVKSGTDAGGTVTYKAKLMTESNDDVAATQASTGTAYALRPDASGYLSTRVPWTDVKVRQTIANTDANWRPMILGAQGNSTEGSSFSTQAADGTYGTSNITAQLSTGTIRANIYKFGSDAEIAYDTTNKCINFNFA